MKDQEILANRIKHYCKLRRMTYYALAYRSAVPLTTLMHIMNGSTKNPGIFTIAKLCNGLDITIPELFDSEEFANIGYDAE